MMDSQKFCLKWDGFQSSVTSVFDHLRQDGELVDITLCCEGHQVRAHKMMLSACSPYFRDLLKNNPCQQMVFFLKDTSAADLSAIIEFMYKGSVNVAQTQLASFIKTAEMLQIRGLSGDDDKPPPSPEERRPPVSRPGGLRSPRPPPPPPPAAKRRRTSDGGPESAAIVGRVSPPPPPQQQHQQPAASPSHYAEFPARSDPAPGGSPPPANHALPPLPAAGGGGGGPPPQSPAGQPSESIKVEKVDLTEEDDDGSLDATLGYVAEYEGAGYGEEPPDLSAMAEAVAAMPGGAVAGPSQRASADDSSATGLARNVCDICGSSYKHRESLYHHKKKHLGLTKCPVCGKVCSIVADLRRHMEVAHQLSSEDVRRIIPTKPKDRISWGQFMAGQ